MAAVEKQPVTGAGPLNGVLTWIDARFPLVKLWEEQWGKYVRAEELQFLVLLRLAGRLWCSCCRSSPAFSSP